MAGADDLERGLLGWESSSTDAPVGHSGRQPSTSMLSDDPEAHAMSASAEALSGALSAAAGPLLQLSREGSGGTGSWLRGGGARETFYCEICLCNEDEGEAWPLENCGHRYCRTCLAGFVQSSVGSGNVGIRCPHLGAEGKPDCETMLSRADVEGLVGQNAELLAK